MFAEEKPFLHALPLEPFRYYQDVERLCTLPVGLGELSGGGDDVGLNQEGKGLFFGGSQVIAEVLHGFDGLLQFLLAHVDPPLRQTAYLIQHTTECKGLEKNSESRGVSWP
jgi:hypothetical protein